MKKENLLNKVKHIQIFHRDKNEKSINKNEESEKNMHFEKLTPDKTVEIGMYKEAIDFVFKEGNKDIRNVAISGPYGAGKSSVLLGYEKDSNHKFKHISLANFDEVDKNQDEKLSNNEMKLEGKIINQLIHQIDYKNIPLTIFKIKKEPSRGITLCRSMAIISIIFGILLFVFMGKYSSLLSQKVVNNSDIIFVIMKFLTEHKYIVLGIWILSLVSIAYLVFTIVCYFYNNNGFRKIKVKDVEIETFENDKHSLFDKYLDEVIYLFEKIDADIIVFEDLDRFGSNQIFTRLREINSLVNMRKSIKKASPIRFFYLIRDDLFETKDRTKFFDYIIPIIPVIDGSNSDVPLVEILTKMQLYNKKDQSFYRAISLYIDDMRLVKNICNEYYVYYKKINQEGFDNKKFFSIILYKNIMPSDFTKLQFGKGFMFNILSEKKKAINEKKKYNENLPKKELFKTEEIKELFDKKKKDLENGNDKYLDLLYYLVCHSYIDETYQEYLTYFREGYYTYSDRKFMLNVYNFSENDEEQKIEKIENVYETIDDIYYLEPGVLNYNLVAYLLKQVETKKDEANNKFKNLLIQLKKNKNFPFVEQYFKKSNNYSILFDGINKEWPEMFHDNIENLEENFIKQYLIVTLNNSDETTLININKDKCLTKYISEKENFLNIKNPNIEKIISSLDVLKVKFKKITLYNLKLLSEVYKEKLYEINCPNIYLMLKEFYQNIKIDDLETKTTSLIYSEEKTPLLEKIESNKNLYFQCILDKDKKIFDDENIVIMILNDDEISDEIKEKYLKLSETKIKTLSDVTNKDLWVSIVENNCVEFSEINIIEYCKNKNLMDDTIVKFINDNRKLDFSSIDEAENKKKVFDLIIKCNEIEDYKYIAALDSLECKEEKFNVIELNDEKIKKMIDKKIIPINADNLNSIRENYGNISVYFILKTIDEYLEIAEQVPPSKDEIRGMINSQLDDELKEKLLKHYKYLISISEINCSDEIKCYILQNNLDINELPELFKEYNNYSEAIRKQLITLVSKHIKLFTDNIRDAEIELIHDFLKDKNIEEEQKLEIIAIYISNEKDVDEIKKCLELASEAKLIQVFDKKKKPQIDDSVNMRKILDIFKEKKYIKNYKIHENRKISVSR